MLYHGNVRGLRDERGDFTENFTLEDTTRLKEALSALRQFGTRMLSFAATEPVAAKLIGLLQYDPVKAGRSLIGLSNCLPVYGQERAQHRRDLLIALRIIEPD
jgi:hypothetical protein